MWLNERMSGEAYYVPTVLADKLCGLAMVQAVLTALHHRDRTGAGQRVDSRDQAPEALRTDEVALWELTATTV